MPFTRSVASAESWAVMSTPAASSTTPSASAASVRRARPCTAKIRIAGKVRRGGPPDLLDLAARAPADAGPTQDGGVDPCFSPRRVRDPLAAAVVGRRLDEFLLELVQVDGAVGGLQLALQVHALLDQLEACQGVGIGAPILNCGQSLLYGFGRSLSPSPRP